MVGITNEANSLPLYLEDGVTAPPFTSNYLAYYEATKQTLDGSDVAAVNYGDVKTWKDQGGGGYDLVQGTAGNRPKLRTFSPTSIYTIGSRANSYLGNATISINKRSTSIFALVDCAQFYSRNNETHTLFELVGGAGTLKYTITAFATAVLVWVDGGGTHTTTIPIPSSLNLIGVILDAAGLTVYCNDVSASFTALTAGSITGLNVMGLAAGGQEYGGGASCFIVYNKALSAGEKTTLDTWAQGRGAKYASQVTAITLADGDSLGYGNASEDRLGFVKQASIGNSILYVTAAGGQTWQNVDDNFPTIQSARYDRTKRCVAWVNCGVNDLITGLTDAQALTKAQTYLAKMRDQGWLIVQNQIATAGLAWLDAGKQAFRAAYNASVAGQSVRKYSNYQLAIPSQLTDFTNLTYFDADQLHWTHAGHAAMTAQGQAALSALLAIPVTTLQAQDLFNGTLLDDTEYTRDAEGINLPTFAAGLSGGQSLVVAHTGPKYARYQFQGAGIFQFYPMTVMFWYKSSDVTTGYNIFVNNVGGSGFTFNYNQGSGQIDFGITATAGGTISKSLAPPSTVNDGVWKAYAFTLDATGYKLYQSPTSAASGLVLVGSQAWTGTPGSAACNGFCEIGSYSAGTIVSDGNFQALRIWSEARTLVQLQAMLPV